MLSACMYVCMKWKAASVLFFTISQVVFLFFLLVYVYFVLRQVIYFICDYVNLCVFDYASDADYVRSEYRNWGLKSCIESIAMLSGWR